MPKHGARFDNFTRVPTNPHGPHSDEGYNRMPRQPHGDQFDEGYRGAEAEARFNQALATLPSEVRNMRVTCPDCNRQHTLEQVMRVGRPSATGKTRDELADVRKSDELSAGMEGADGLHAALVDSINKTYSGERPSTPQAVAKTAEPSFGDHALADADLHGAMVSLVRKHYGIDGPETVGKTRPARRTVAKSITTMPIGSKCGNCGSHDTHVLTGGLTYCKGCHKGFDSHDDMQTNRPSTFATQMGQRHVGKSDGGIDVAKSRSGERLDSAVAKLRRDSIRRD